MKSGERLKVNGCIILNWKCSWKCKNSTFYKYNYTVFLYINLFKNLRKTKTGQAALLAQRKRETYLQRELSKGVHTLQPGKDASFEVKEIKRKWMMAQVKCRQLQTHLNCT